VKAERADCEIEGARQEARRRLDLTVRQDQPRPDDCPAMPDIELGEQRRQRLRIHLGVAVEKDQRRRVRVEDRAIGRSAESKILLALEYAEASVGDRAQPIDCVIR